MVKDDWEKKTPVKEAVKAKPGFLGRIGAMIGLMQQSKFVDQNEDAKDDGRLGSASTYKSRDNNSR